MLILLIIWAVGAALWTLLLTPVALNPEILDNPETIQFAKEHPGLVNTLIVISGILWPLTFPYGLGRAIYDGIKN